MSATKFSVEPYIIQKSIPLVRFNGKKFEIRAVMQKNSKGMWYRTCMVIRSSGDEEKLISINNEIDIKSTEVLKDCFGSKAEIVKNKIRRISKSIVSLMDKRKMQIGELAIDFGVDKNLNVYIIELNSKPDNLLSSIGAFRMRNLAIYRILEYAKFLAHN